MAIEHVTAPASGAAPIFGALGDPCRLAAMETLCRRGPLATRDMLDAGSGISRQGMTKHLQVLEDAGLIESYRVGRDRHWRVREQQIAELRARLDQLTLAWETRLQRLKAFVESN